jgi:hypothetical protein
MWRHRLSHWKPGSLRRLERSGFYVCRLVMSVGMRVRRIEEVDPPAACYTGAQSGGESHAIVLLQKLRD